MRFRLPPWAIAALFLALFAVLNGRAYLGYFSDDDLDNLAWTSYVGIEEFAKGFFDPRVSPHNFRPMGHIYFWVLGRLAGENFIPYVAVIQALHLLNAALLWFLLRRLGYEPRACWIAAFVWTFHFALFDAVWKPMYIFDVTCGLFCLLTLHAWLRERWLLAVLAFWCAYKSKEVALFLPAVLALYELTAGQRRWKPLLPLLAISASFGLQAVLAPKGPETDYTLKFTWDALRKTAPFYYAAAGGIGIIVLSLPGLERSRRWSLAGALLMLAPLLFLPGRLFAVYLYVPLLIGAAAYAIPFRANAGVILMLALWSAYNYRQLRDQWRAYLPWAAEQRAFITQLGAFSRKNADLKTLIYTSPPRGTNSWGPPGAVHWLSRNPAIEVRYEERPKLPPPAGTGIVAWNSARQRLEHVR
jgi:hypothetical protein